MPRLVGIAEAGARRRVRLALTALTALITAIAVYGLLRRAGPHLLRATPPPPLTDGTHPCVRKDGSAVHSPPRWTQCPLLTEKEGAVDEWEVDLRYGSFVLRQTDLSLHDIFDVPLTRAYSSNDWLGSARSQAFGISSNHVYDIAPLGTRNPYTYQVLALADGDEVYFERISAGTGYADAVFQHSATSTRFYGATQSWNGHGWTLRLRDGSRIEFPESYSARNLAQGAATAIYNGDGDALQLRRDARRNLREIVTPHGRRIMFRYDQADRVVEADDDRGASAAYSYNKDGLLTEVVRSTGSKRQYEYAGVRMTAVRDEGGHVLVRNRYRDGVVAQQEYPDGSIFSYDYVWNAERTAARQVSVTLPDGTRQTIFPKDPTRRQ